MEDFEKYKGIHPGAVLERVLKKKNISQRTFALSLPEHPQTLNAITKGKRDLNIALSLKIEKSLNIEEGTFMMLQVYHDIKKEKQKNNTPSPDLAIIRKILFWDVDMQKIDWGKHYQYVIKRVFERGNEEEKNEILNFYGQQKIDEVIIDLPTSGNHIILMPHLNKH